MEATEYLDVLRDRSSAILAAARDNLEAHLPTCPGWTMADLVAHVGGVWGWGAATVRTGVRTDQRPTPGNLGGAELIGWAEDCRRQVLDALEAVNPDSNCWTFGLPRTRLFWFRRQALESAVHAFDAQSAAGHLEPLGHDLAVDGIEEFLTAMLPRIVSNHPNDWTGQTLHLRCADGGGEWFVRLGPDAAVSVEHGHEEADIALMAAAPTLYLWILNRLPSSDLEVLGDRSIADRWTSEIAF